MMTLLYADYSDHSFYKFKWSYSDAEKLSGQYSMKCSLWSNDTSCLVKSEALEMLARSVQWLENISCLGLGMAIQLQSAGCRLAGVAIGCNADFW